MTKKKREKKTIEQEKEQFSLNTATIRLIFLLYIKLLFVILIVFNMFLIFN